MCMKINILSLFRRWSLSRLTPHSGQSDERVSCPVETEDVLLPNELDVLPLNDEQATDALLTQFLSSVAPLPEESEPFVQQVMQRVERKRQRAWWWRGVRLAASFVVGVLVVQFLLSAVLLLLPSQTFLSVVSLLINAFSVVYAYLFEVARVVQPHLFSSIMVAIMLSGLWWWNAETEEKLI